MSGSATTSCSWTLQQRPETFWLYGSCGSVSSKRVSWKQQKKWEISRIHNRYTQPYKPLVITPPDWTAPPLLFHRILSIKMQVIYIFLDTPDVFFFFLWGMVDRGLHTVDYDSEIPSHRVNMLRARAYLIFNSYWFQCCGNRHSIF